MPFALRRCNRCFNSSFPGLFLPVVNYLVHTGKTFACDLSRSSPVRIHDPSLNLSRAIRLFHISRRRTAGRGNEGSRPTPTDFLLTTFWGGWMIAPTPLTCIRDSGSREGPSTAARLHSQACHMWHWSLCDTYVRGSYTSCSLASFARESPFITRARHRFAAGVLLRARVERSQVDAHQSDPY